MKRLKKILALLFALTMMLSMVLGSVVYADESEEDAKNRYETYKRLAAAEQAIF